ncbi:MAG: hypothetical protein KGR98_13480, partial [Verrucomicrobia bacterium]|nr:hypothetical protein [Verrucomicrobiota bacterium]
MVKAFSAGRHRQSGAPPWLGIALGDVTGVGPEVALKAVAAESKNNRACYLFIGDAGALQRANRKFSVHLPLKPFSASSGFDAGRFFVLNPPGKPLPSDLP